MDDLWPGRPLSELLEDLEVSQVMLGSLHPSQDDFRSSRMELENKIKYLKHEIDKTKREDAAQGFDGTTNSFEYPSNGYHGQGNIGSDISPPFTGTSSPSLPSFQQGPDLMSPSMSLPSRKRQFEHSDLTPEYQQQAKSRKPTPSPNQSLASSPTISSSDDFGDDEVLQRLFGRDIGNEYRGLGKESKRAERELRERREQERRDEEMARALQDEWNQAQSQPPPSFPRSSSQALLDRATGGIRSMPPPPIPSKPNAFETKAANHSQEQVAPSYLSKPNWSFDSMPGSFSGAGSSNILDLGSDDEDDDEYQIIPSSEFTPNPNRLMGQTNASRPIDLTMADAGYSIPNTGNLSYAGYGGTSVYYPGRSPNAAYEFVDQHINSFGASASGFARQPGLSNIPGAYPPTSYSPIDLTGPAPWENWRDFGDESTGNTEEEIKNLLENIRPDEEIASETSEGDPEAMKVALMAHQKLGLAWMKAMEEGSNKGGILADDMGLGKTIQALALIVSRPSEDSQRKTTLIVAPVALMQQWKREIEKKIRPAHRLSTLVLHGTDRNTAWRDLKNYDIVLTTYGTLATEIKRKHMWDQKLKANPNIRASSKDDLRPILGDDCKWYRVILDESQHIKNKATKAALGAWHIRSTYRWCMSGTPMMNNVFELFSLIHFLRIKPYNVLENFNREFAKPLKSNRQSEKEHAMRALQALLKAILLRRTKKSEINGQPILQLPPKIVEVTHALFSEDEQAFYSALEKRTQLTFNKYMKAGTVGRNYSNVLVLLLRLRQACCHPHLIKDFSIDTGSVNGEVDLKANAEAFSKEAVARLKEVESFDCPVCLDACENPQIFFPCGHPACLECLSRLMDPEAGLARGEDRVQLRCPTCRADVDPHKVTDWTNFKAVHNPPPEEEVGPAIEDGDEVEEDSGSETETGSESEDDDEADEESDDDDDDDDDSIKDFVVDDENEEALKEENSDDDDDDLSSRPPSQAMIKKPVQTGEEGDQSEQPKPLKKGKEKAKSKSKRRSKKKGKGKERDKLEKNQLSLAQLRKQGLRNKDAKRKYLKRLEENWITSAKINKTIEILTEVHERGQYEKTIVFSAFTSLLDLLEVPVFRQKWNYKRYDGSMTPAERNAAVNEFTDNKNCTVMLVSLKAGNSGLNLTAANNVVIFDPFWNPYIEEQAIDRAYRIGQTKDVHVHRVIVEGTVEDRILALQEKKRELIESALDENAGRSVARLGERELAYLFVSVNIKMKTARWLTFPTGRSQGCMMYVLQRYPPNLAACHRNLSDGTISVTKHGVGWDFRTIKV